MSSVALYPNRRIEAGNFLGKNVNMKIQIQTNMKIHKKHENTINRNHFLGKHYTYYNAGLSTYKSKHENCFL